MKWLLERMATATQQAAFIHDEQQTTYGEVLARVAAFEQRLRTAGLAAGDRVAVLGDYSPELFCLLLALARLRAVAIPLSHSSVIEHGAAMAISGCDWRASFGREPTGWELQPWRLEPADGRPPLLREFQRGCAPGLILFSSGSTGRPKAILHDMARVAEKFRNLRPPVRAIPFLMVDHFGGINTLLAITSSLGTVVTVKERGVAAVCAAIDRYRVTLLPTTPSFLTLLMTSGEYRSHDLRSLQRITYGTEVMPQSTLDRVRDAFPWAQLQQTYGLSEIGVLGSRSRGDGSTWVRIGGQGFETKVVDGILWIRSAYAMVGYLNAASDFDKDGWFNTHDRVEVEGEYFRILGRSTDIINVAGQKVYPAEVEDAILRLENIQDVAVSGESHPLLGQMVVAKVRLLEPEDVAALKLRLRRGCAARLSAYKVPAKVVVVDEAFTTSRQKKQRRTSAPPQRAETP